MASTNYKQWPAKVRNEMYVKYKAARGAGSLPPPGPCEICGQTEGTMHHAEDYGPTIVEYFASLHSLCARCHAMLHLRFRFPGQWAAYKEVCRRTGPQPVTTMIKIFYSVKSDMPIDSAHDGIRWWDRI